LRTETKKTKSVLNATEMREIKRALLRKNTKKIKKQTSYAHLLRSGKYIKQYSTQSQDNIYPSFSF